MEEGYAHNADAGRRPARLAPLRARKYCGELRIALQALQNRSAFVRAGHARTRAAALVQMTDAIARWEPTCRRASQQGTAGRRGAQHTRNIVKAETGVLAMAG